MSKKNLCVFLITIYFSLIAISAFADSHSDKQLKVGLIVPLSGPLAFFGNDYLRAIDIAVEDNPEINKYLKIIWEDSAYDSKQAVSAFNKLISVDKVDVVFSFGGPMLNALAPIAEAKKIPFFATESEKSDCKGRQFCSLFRNEEDEWGKATWAALRELNKKKIGIVKNQNQFMNTFVDAIIRTKSDEESVTILLDVPPDTVDFRTSILSLKSKEVDSLGIFLLTNSYHGFFKALNNNPMQYHLFGLEGFLVKEYNKGTERLVENAIAIAPSSLQDFREKFEKKYGESAGFYYTPAAYDFIILLKDIFSANPTLRGLDLVNAMHFKGERSGVSGKYTVKKSKEGVHSYSFPIAVYELKNGETTVKQIINF